MSFTEETNPLKKGINRRDLIKKGAVAGAVFWSVPIIESVTSKAAAGSSSISCSWAYIVWAYTPLTRTSTVYVSGYSNTFQTGSASTCEDYSNTSGMTNNSIITCPAAGTTATTYTLASGGKGADAVTFSGYQTSNGGVGLPPPNCTDVSQAGNTITVASDVVILAYFVGPHGQNGYCGPGTAGTGVTLSTNC